MKKRASSDKPPIEILNWREAVRKRPAMYVGRTGAQGFVHLFKEFFASFFSIIDSERILKAEFLSFEITGKNSGIFFFEKLSNRIPSNISENLRFYALDFPVLNALSENYELTLFDKNKKEILKQIYRQGILQSGKIDDKEYSAESLQIRFDLDESIWENFEINPIFFSDLIKEIAFLNKDKTFEIKYFVNNEPCRIIYRFENGLKEMIDAEKPKSWGETLFDTHFEKGFEEFSVEIAFCFWNYSINAQFFKSFVNNLYTHENGTHAKALTAGIIKASKKYVKNYFPEKHFVITERTVYSFLLAAIHIKMNKPTFDGSTRNRLINKEIIKPLSDHIAKLLFEKFENDEEKAKNVIRHFAEIHWSKNRLKRT